MYEQWEDDLWIIQSKRYTPYYVVDGQQRLTTALIFIQCILEQISDSDLLNYSSTEEIRKKFIFESRDGLISRSYLFGYEKDNPSYEYLKTRIFKERPDNYHIGEETIYTQNLMSAKLFFKNRLKSLSLEDIERYYTKISQHFLFNIYVISGEIDVFVAFETMNNRGKPLSHLELLKNRLIFLSTRLNDDLFDKGALRKTINESWKTAYHFLGRNKARPLKDDRFLTAQFILYAAKHIGSEELSSANEIVVDDSLILNWPDHRVQRYLLEKYFSTRNLVQVATDNENGSGKSIVITGKTIDRYAQDIKRTVETYYRLMNPEDAPFSDEVRVHLERIRRLGWRDALPLAVACVHSGASDSDLAALFGRLERFLFIREVQSRHTNVKPDLREMAVKFVGSDGRLSDILDQVHRFSEQTAANIELGESLWRWAGERAYYGWRTLRYFLYEYEQDLKRKSKSSRDKLIWEEFVRDNYESDFLTIEHIYPRRASDLYWKERFNIYSVKQRNALRNSLGNLLALSKAKNSSIGNRAYPEKREGVAGESGYRVGSYSEIEVAKEENWTPQHILNRGLSMLEFMEKRWRIKLGDRKKKISILQLAFMEDVKEIRA